jgi:hypothetical protein
MINYYLVSISSIYERENSYAGKNVYEHMCRYTTRATSNDPSRVDGLIIPSTTKNNVKILPVICKQYHEDDTYVVDFITGKKFGINPNGPIESIITLTPKVMITEDLARDILRPLTKEDAINYYDTLETLENDLVVAYLEDARIERQNEEALRQLNNMYR